MQAKLIRPVRNASHKAKKARPVFRQAHRQARPKARRPKRQRRRPAADSHGPPAGPHSLSGPIIPFSPHPGPAGGPAFGRRGAAAPRKNHGPAGTGPYQLQAQDSSAQLGRLREALRILLEKIPMAWQTAFEDQRRRGWPNGLALEAEAGAMLRVAEDLSTLLLKYRFALTTHFLCKP